MKIYLSEFEVSKSISRANQYDKVVNEIISFCQKDNFQIYRSNEFTDYKTIEDKIEKSDLLIAVVDEYWLSSTWKLHEVFYALGDYAGMGKAGSISRKVEVILFYSEPVHASILENIKSFVATLSEIENLIQYIKGIAQQ